MIRPIVKMMGREHQNIFLAWEVQSYYGLQRSNRHLHYLHMKSSIFLSQVRRVNHFAKENYQRFFMQTKWNNNNTL